jgi:hypothetical protein
MKTPRWSALVNYLRRILIGRYPVITYKRTAGEAKDAVQVRTMAAHFAALDDAGELSRLFAGPACLTPEDRERIEREEGWTLGVLSGRQLQPRLPLQPLAVSPSTPSTVTGSMSIDRNDPSIGQADREAGLPECDFVYFATPACGSWTITAEFVDSAKAIIAHAYNNVGLRMPIVQHLRGPTGGKAVSFLHVMVIEINGGDKSVAWSPGHRRMACHLAAGGGS